VTTLHPGARIHIVGVGGAGMSALARLLHEMGGVVSGSDEHDSPVLDQLRQAGITVYLGHSALNVEGAEVLLWSPAVATDHIELAHARDDGATLLSRAEVLSQLALLQPVVGLTGTHGKTTATSMMVHVLAAAGRDDSRLLGAPVRGIGENGHWGDAALVLEVDESYGTFSLLSPYALGLLNVEADHLDHYGTLATLEEAFTQLVQRTSGPVVAWADDEGAKRVSSRSTKEVLYVAARARAPWRVSNVQLARREASFDLDGPEHSLALHLEVTGLHNVANAAVVAVLALAIGVDDTAVRDGLADFSGAPRRFDLLGRWGEVDVYEDYAHLPGEIAATLAATRSAGYERITAVFQPHRVSRTQRLAAELAASLEGANHVVVTDIYPAGELNPEGLTGEVVARHLLPRSSDATSSYAATFDDVLEKLLVLRDESDVILLLGAGDIATIASRFPGGLLA
jgi:UDP-N-acetylmuramate--alanine ligase